MSVGEAIVKYFNDHDDIAALAVDKKENPEIIQAFLSNGARMISVECHYTNDLVYIGSMLVELSLYELKSERLEKCRHINSLLKYGCVKINELDAVEYIQAFPYQGLEKIDSLLDVAIMNIRVLSDKCAEDAGLYMLSKMISNIKSENVRGLVFIR
jgi:hypothetical protein